MITLLKRKIKEMEGNYNMTDNNVLTEEQKEFKELLQDLLMEQQEQA